MRYYEYDEQGWLIGWHGDANRDRSTAQVPPKPAGQARFIEGAWTLDPSREQQREADETAERTKRQQAIAIIKAYNPSTATAAEVRATVGAQNVLLRDIIQELKQ